MFAVPGWSVPAASIKAETAGTTASDPQNKPKKRRRANASKQDVTGDNVADLWEKVIEQRVPVPHAKKKDSGSKLKAKSKERKKRQEAAGTSTPPSKEPPADDEEWGGFESEIDDADQPKAKKPKNKDSRTNDRVDASVAKKDKVANNRRESKDKGQPDGKSPNPKSDKAGDAASGKPRSQSESTEQVPTAATTAPPAAPKLTPLQASMREKLISARFRHLNETLYTRPSAESFKLFADSPEMFAEYHEGFRRQVGVWPDNPVTGYIAEIRARGRIKPNRRPYAPPPSSTNTASSAALLPLPRTDGTCVIADLGCGDAALAAALQPVARRLGLDVRSYDLQSPSPLVTRADIADLPLRDGAVDVAIFCLALMGTNWVDFVEEAYRILHWKGELWVAEIKSRFAAAATKGKKQGGTVVEHSVGNRRKVPATSAAGKKAKSAAAEADGVAAEAQLAVEVDGVEDRRQDTNVSAFVDALGKRGFVLRGDPSEAVDLDNKMFVKMYFVKAATPTKGKGVPSEPRGGSARPAKKKFIPTARDEEGPADESAILKPCVYKLR